MSQSQIKEQKIDTKSRVSKNSKLKFCHIHDKIKGWDDVNYIRANVCLNNGELFNHNDGNIYCLFHLPTTDKQQFEKKFNERLAEIENQISEAEKLDESKESWKFKTIYYDFRYFCFPSERDFSNYVFKALTSFSTATFMSSVSFIGTKFKAPVDFSFTTFSIANFTAAEFTSADFSLATFNLSVDFIGTNFTEDADFTNAIFTKRCIARFSKSVFLKEVHFKDAEFHNEVSFSRARFGSESKVHFRRTKFGSNADFGHCTAEGYIRFSGAKISRESRFDFQEAAFEKASRVSFHTVRLQPNWFVNFDARKFIFTDIEWLGLEIDVDRNGLQKEVDELKRSIQRPDEPLRKALNQLADNAEANHRFEEAKQFRKNAVALQYKECHIHDSIDEEYKAAIRKNVCGDYPVVNEDAGNYFCLWHNPDKNKAGVFLKEFRKRIEKGHRNFQGVVFPITVAYKIPKTDYKGKIITETIPLPEKVDFSHSTFQKRFVIEDNTIHDLILHNIFIEKGAEFVIKNSRCDGRIDFTKAVIDGKLFIEGKDERENWRENLTDKEVFLNTEQVLSLYDARIENPEGINFRFIRLRPHYFDGVDAGRFVFHDCEWTKKDEKEISIAEEIALSSHKAIAQACNKLAVNYEENRHYEESSAFRYTAMEAKRLNPENSFGKIFNLYWLYKWTSGYGESRGWATGVLVALILSFGLVYATNISVFEPVNAQPNPNEWIIGRLCRENRITGNAQGISVCDGLVHSLAVASFQRPEPKPANSFTKFLVTLETILAPLQAALLALAIRRKFMR